MTPSHPRLVSSELIQSESPVIKVDVFGRGDKPLLLGCDILVRKEPECLLSSGLPVPSCLVDTVRANVRCGSGIGIGADGSVCVCSPIPVVVYTTVSATVKGEVHISDVDSWLALAGFSFTMCHPTSLITSVYSSSRNETIFRQNIKRAFV